MMKIALKIYSQMWNNAFGHEHIKKAQKAAGNINWII